MAHLEDQETASLLGGGKVMRLRGGGKDFEPEDIEDCCPCCSPVTQRAWVGWTCATLGCAVLEFVGIYTYYHFNTVVAVLMSLVTVILLSYLSAMSMISLPWPDRAGQNFFFRLLIFVAYLSGLCGAMASGFHFRPYLQFYYGNDYVRNAKTQFLGVHPDEDPLALENPSILEFSDDTYLHLAQMSRAEFDSQSEHHWDSWRSCVTPIVSRGTHKKINFWAVTEGELDCEPPKVQEDGRPIEGSKGVVLATTSASYNHAKDAAEAAANTFNLEMDPNSIFVFWTIHAEEYQNQRLERALVGCLVPFFCFPLLCWPLYVVMAAYLGRGYSLCSGVDSKLKRRRRRTRAPQDV